MNLSTIFAIIAWFFWVVSALCGMLYVDQRDIWLLGTGYVSLMVSVGAFAMVCLFRQ